MAFLPCIMCSKQFLINWRGPLLLVLPTSSILKIADNHPPVHILTIVSMVFLRYIEFARCYIFAIQLCFRGLLLILY